MNPAGCSLTCPGCCGWGTNIKIVSGEISVMLLNNMNLTGPIPMELYQLTGLVHLQLANNSLAGTISPKIADLSNLTVLRLQGNRLSGSLPLELGNSWILVHSKRVTTSSAGCCLPFPLRNMRKAAGLTEISSPALCRNTHPCARMARQHAALHHPPALLENVLRLDARSSGSALLATAYAML